MNWRYGIYLILFFLILSCEEEKEWYLHTKNLPVIVVDGILTNEKKAHEIRLTRPVTEMNQTPKPVSSALVAVFDGSKVYILHEDPVNPGLYKTIPEFRALYGKQYMLYIKFQDQEYTANASMKPVTPLKPINISYVGELFKIELQDSDEPSMIEVYLDWSHLPGYKNKSADETHAKLVFYSLNSIDVNEMFKPGKETILFPGGTKILRKKYSLSDDHQKFLRTMLSETEWKGGVFDVLPGNVYTNLSEGA
ncbi:MAG: DUF4249 family protein, partial [Bacteroidetes bacterium]|nr:DUF4249 family protein [Bacteroidota bacterium]